MDLFGLILVIYLCYKNWTRAKLKEQNPLVWALITGVCVFIGEVIGMAIVMTYFCRDVVDISKLQKISNLSDPAYKAATQALAQAFADNPLHSLTVEAFGVGGYLLIRYILNNKPDKKEPEIHWMDKLGEQ